MTASAHVLVFRPLIERLRARGDEVEITARDYAQTLQLLELHGLDAEVIGRHGGRSRLGKLRALQTRLRALRRWARRRDFDVALASIVLPERAVDAQSLIALADLVVSAGGTMNREAAALGVPVYTTYGGRLGGVDEELIRQGRLKPLTDPRALELDKRSGRRSERIRRDPM